MAKAILLTSILTSWSTSTNAFVLQQPIQPLHFSSKEEFVLEGKYDPYEDSSSRANEDALSRNKARTDLRNFLTQRSIQSFIFLLNQCKEEHTVRWLENKLDFKNIDGFHGTGAFNITLFPEWDSLFLDLASQEPESVIIEVKQRICGRRGWGHQSSYFDSLATSSNSGDAGFQEAAADPNISEKSVAAPPSGKKLKGTTANYLENLNSPAVAVKSRTATKPKNAASSPVKRTTGSYLDALGIPQKETSPSSTHLERRKTGRKTRKERELIQSQKAEELQIGTQGGYLGNLSKNVLNATSEAPLLDGHEENPHLEEKIIEYEFDIDPASLVTRIMSVREQISKEWKEDLDTLVRTNDQILDDYEDRLRETEAALDDDEDDDEDEVDSLKDVASPEGSESLTCHRDAMIYIANSIASQDRAASPFRNANFDLLLLLCTQESIHRVLREYSQDDEDEFHQEKHDWLHSNYKESVKEHFDGHRHGFGRANNFLETILAESPVAREKRDGSLYLINPVAVVDDILQARSAVAREWKSIIATIPDEHLDIRRVLFARQLMEVTDWKLNGIGTNSLHIEETSQATEKVFDTRGAFE